MSLPTLLAHRLAERPQECQWLIDELWGDEAVGIVGGEPKTASRFSRSPCRLGRRRVPCLRRFAPMQTGRVLLFAAEERSTSSGSGSPASPPPAGACSPTSTSTSSPHLRCARSNPTATPLPPPSLRSSPSSSSWTHSCACTALMRTSPRGRTAARVPARATAPSPPRLVLVHHARKAARRCAPSGAARSSEFHAWGDSNLYLRRTRTAHPVVEHRAAGRSPRSPCTSRSTAMPSRSPRWATAALRPAASSAPIATPALHGRTEDRGAARRGRRAADRCRDPEALPDPERHADRGAHRTRRTGASARTRPVT